MPARIEGGRFAVWISEAGMKLGAHVAERLRGKISGAPWDWRGQAWSLATSLGVAVRCHGEDTEAMMTQAITALSLAKRNGGNRVETAG